MRQQEIQIQNILALVLMLIISVMVLMLFYRETPPTNKELVSLALGVLLGSMKDVFNYFFGSTRSSDRKDEIVRSALNQTTPTPSDGSIQITPPAHIEVTTPPAGPSDPGFKP